MATDDTIYVAVGEAEDSVLTLLWTLQNLSPLKVCILHVHQPSRMISSRVVGNLADFMFDQELRRSEDVGKEMMHQKMDEYLHLCRQAGVSAEKLYIQRDEVANGILELIQRHNIKKLVMGAAADDQFSEGMWLESEKAQYVNENAPDSCQIWFICGEHLVHTRFETGQPSNALSPSGSSYSSSSSEVAGIVYATVFEEREESECDLEPFVLLHSRDDRDSLSMPNEGSSNHQLYDQLEQALQEVETSNRKAFEESERRIKAEKITVQAKREAKTFERLYFECKRKSEPALAKLREELEKMKRQRDEERKITVEQKSILESQAANSDYRMKELEGKLSTAIEQLKISQKERDALQVELENTRKVAEELLRKQAEETSSTSETHDAILDQLKVCQKEKDELLTELENTQKINEELLRKQAEETSNPHLQQNLTEFSLSDIQEATEDFHPRFKIAEGYRGSVYYRCFLRHTEVAIKVIRQNIQDPTQFQQEVDDLSKSRHPNLVTLIGTCPEIWALIYEYLPNGSLEDHLNCRDDTPPLSWQTRIHIATELCYTLMFLHSCKPQSVVHGNLKPGNILLDSNFCCKLTDFGACRALSLLANTSNTHPYLDPDFRNTSILSKSLDLYPFGIILLQLLSGRSTQGIAESAKNALRSGGNLNSFLDSSAGNWPYQVSQLIHLAIRCCEINRSRRPDLASEVLEVLKTMKTSSGASSSFLAESEEENREPPSYFVCPILQEVMINPHFAADGYTYEMTALQEWLADHETSPLTNLRLEHQNLVPNYALRSAIQEWQQSP